jgi:hypothetical protein
LRWHKILHFRGSFSVVDFSFSAAAAAGKQQQNCLGDGVAVIRQVRTFKHCRISKH